MWSFYDIVVADTSATCAIPQYANDIATLNTSEPIKPLPTQRIALESLIAAFCKAYYPMKSVQ